MRTPTRHVSKDDTVTWKVRFRYGNRDTSETFDTQGEAIRFAGILDAAGPQAALADLDNAAAQRAVPTLEQLAVDHIAHLTGIEEGTRLNYTRLWDRTWGPLVGDVPANLLSRDRVAAATNSLAGRYSAKSLKNQRGLLAAVCERAVEHGYLTANPTKRLRLPRGKESERREMQILTPDEFGRILDAVRPHYRPLTEFLGATGCRWGEAVAVTVGDLNLAARTVRIRRALKWSPDNNRTIGATKTRRSNRTIVLPPEVVPPLAEVVAGRKKAELVFTAPRGGPVQHRTYWSDIWMPAVAAAGVDPRPRIHDIRHSHAAWLLGAGVPIHVVQARLGHESIQTTVDTYGGMLPDAQIRAAEAAALVFRRQIEP